MQGAQVWSLVGELRSLHAVWCGLTNKKEMVFLAKTCKPANLCSQKKKKKMVSLFLHLCLFFFNDFNVDAKTIPIRGKMGRRDKLGVWNWHTLMLSRSVVSCSLISVTPWAAAHLAPLSIGILQARILEWVAMPSTRGSSQSRDQTQVSWIAGRFFTIWLIGEAHTTIFIYTHTTIFKIYNQQGPTV